MDWVLDNVALIISLSLDHLRLSVIPIAMGFLVSLPLGWYAHRYAWSRGIVLTTVGLLYTVPSLALFMLLPPVLGISMLSQTNVLVALSLYAAAIMVRNAADAFASIDPAALRAATALGYAEWGRFFAVELPLAGPVLVAGLRVVAVSTVSLVTVGVLVGVPQSGLFLHGWFPTAHCSRSGHRSHHDLSCGYGAGCRVSACGSNPVALVSPGDCLDSEPARMNLFLEAWWWLLSPEQYVGQGGIPQRIGEHLYYTFVAVGIAAAIAIPVGYFIGHTGRGGVWLVGIAGAARALPSFGLMLLLGVAIRGVGTRQRGPCRARYFGNSPLIGRGVCGCSTNTPVDH